MLLLQVQDEELRRLIGERIRIARGRSKLTQQHAAPSALQLLHLGRALGERPETFLEGLVQLTWEKIALDLPDDAKAIVYDLAKYLKERGPVPRPASEIIRGA